MLSKAFPSIVERYLKSPFLCLENTFEKRIVPKQLKIIK